MNHRLRLPLAVLSSLAACLTTVSACKTTKEASSPKELVDAVNSGKIGATALPGDLPLAGRSLFDQLTMVAKDGSFVQSVPYPFSALVDALAKDGESEPFGTLLPRGRSLQRDVVRDRAFANPRLVTVFQKFGKRNSPTNDDLGLTRANRLYMGYVEVTNQIEVISYNDQAGRFDFQVINNYGPGLKPEVRYASRALCTSCHQTGAPIFSRDTWEETPVNEMVRRQLALALGPIDSYLGIKIDNSTGNLGQLGQGPFISGSQAIEDNAGEANTLIIGQRLWREACRLADPAQTRRCRRLAVESVLASTLGAAQNSRIEFAALFAQGWALNLPPILAIPTFRLEPFATLLSDNPVRLATDADVPDDDNPLIPHKAGVLSNLAAGDTKGASNGAYKLLRAIFGILNDGLDRTVLTGPEGNSWPQLHLALDQLERDPGQVFAKDTFDRCSLMLAITGKLSWWKDKVLRCGYTVDEMAKMPPPQATGGDASIAAGDPDLVRFQTYCSACHANDPLPFMRGATVEAIKANLQSKSKVHIARLDWDTAIPSLRMPPAGTNQRKALEANEADRAKMLAFLRGL